MAEKFFRGRRCGCHDRKNFTTAEKFGRGSPRQELCYDDRKFLPRQDFSAKAGFRGDFEVFRR
jgi:hypothetical protein